MAMENKDSPKTLQHDGQLTIAVGKSRHETNWRNTQTSWSRLVDRLSHVTRTAETAKEYRRMTTEQRGDAKDVGGFVGGTIQGGRRKRDSISWRQVVTLDADYLRADDDIVFLVDASLGCACAAYSTHSHTQHEPRIRLVLPLTRPVTPEEYQAVSRKLADKINIDYFDDTTYEPHRLMYWPSCPKDAEYLFDYLDLPWIDPDTILDEYTDWRDPACWPESSRQRDERQRMADRQGEPTEKGGLVGAFCRTYTIHDVITKYLNEVYDVTDDPNRYTYTGGTTHAGLVVYDDVFAYSHHATDPVGGKLVNAFDLVRLHRFGPRDDEIPEDTPVQDRPSHKEMESFASQDKTVRQRLAREKQEQAASDFDKEDEEGDGGQTAPDPDAWLGELQYNQKGHLIKNIQNLLLILRHDPQLQGIAYNEHEHLMETTQSMPWRHRSEGYGKSWTDSDDAHLRNYIEQHYGLRAPALLMDAVEQVSFERRFHPIKRYLASLPPWDGKPRVENLLHEYLGAEDTLYTREATKKTLVAAVARIYQPGVKFDYMLVLSGPQGVGKSTLFQRLGGAWFNDSLSMQDTKDKTAAEKLQGYWILEIGELAGIRKVEVESVKSFLSRQEDVYRPAYGRRTIKSPRQCIIVGSTNADTGFLRDTTGNRRFWPVPVAGVSRDRAPWNISDSDVAQIWAEAKYLFEQGETLYLQGEAESQAFMYQQASMEADERIGMVQDYLDTIVPLDWYNMTLQERRQYLDDDFGEPRPDSSHGLLRDRICVSEIWCECFGYSRSSLQRRDSDEIHAIMKQIPGWTRYTGTRSGKAKFPIYGTQRAYVRQDDNE